MSIFTGADYYIRHDQEPDADPKVLDGLTVENLTTLVNKAALNNSDLHNEAVRKADSYSFSTAHPELLQTAKNIKLINHWLQTRGVSQPNYPDFDAAFTALSAENLLELDAAEIARDKTHRTFRGALTGQTFDSVDDMIVAERQAALHNLRPDEASPEELALEQLPIEQVKVLLREGERHIQRKPKLVETRLNGDSWFSLNPWYVDDDRNSRLMKMQLAANGFSDDTKTIEQFEICARQLRESGLLTLNKTAVAKERVAEVAQHAAEAVKQHGTIFDNTSEEDMYNLPLEELKRRANGIYA